MSYEQTRRDFEYLEELAEVEDMVTIDAVVWDLMRDPTKKHAEKMYLSSINLWFGEHGGDFDDDDRVLDIRDRHL